MNSTTSNATNQRLAQCVDCLCSNLAQSPVAYRLLGLCPLLVVTTSVLKALSISILLLLVGVFSVALGSLLRSTVIWRLKAVHFAVIASVSTLIVVNAIGIRFPALVDSLGIYALLLAANCQVISQLQEMAEHHSLTNTIPRVIRDGGWVLVFAVVIALIREFASYGIIFHDWPLLYGLPAEQPPNGWLPFLAQPGGALIILGMMLGILNLVTQRNTLSSNVRADQRLAEEQTGQRSAVNTDTATRGKTSRGQNFDG